MSEMRRRIAQAIQDEMFDPIAEYVRKPHDLTIAFKLADAALKAMREPTPEMIAAAWEESLAEDAKGTWRAMIDTVLGETT